MSITAISRETGLSRSAIRYRLEKGIPLDKEKDSKDKHKGFAQNVTYRGKQYKSWNALGKAFGISDHSAKHYLLNGWPLEDARLRVENGGLTELSFETGLTKAAIKYRRSRGIPLYQKKSESSELKGTPQPIEYEGKKYRSLSALGRAYNLTERQVRHRLAHQIPLDSVLGKEE